jgi:hypothetical protein
MLQRLVAKIPFMIPTVEPTPACKKEIALCYVIWKCWSFRFTQETFEKFVLIFVIPYFPETCTLSETGI